MQGRVNRILVLLLGAYLLIFLQSHLDAPRLWLGFKPDLTPALLVCVGLCMGAGHVWTTAVLAGLWLDSLSANPLGVSILPLFAAGWLVYCFREKILGGEFVAQFYLGTFAGLFVPLTQLGLLKIIGETPLLGWEMGLWSLFNALCCGAAVPLFDRLAKRLVGWFSHPVYDPNRGPNENRQIVRGKD